MRVGEHVLGGNEQGTVLAVQIDGWGDQCHFHQILVEVVWGPCHTGVSDSVGKHDRQVASKDSVILWEGPSQDEDSTVNEGRPQLKLVYLQPIDHCSPFLITSSEWQEDE